MKAFRISAVLMVVLSAAILGFTSVLRADCTPAAGTNGDDTIVCENASTGVDGGEGSDTITNNGTTSGEIAGGDSDDTITNNGSFGSIDAGDGDDEVVNNNNGGDIAGGDGDDTITNNGGAGDLNGDDSYDTITNNGQAGALNGGADADSIYNDGQAESIDGGDGDDVIITTAESFVEETIVGGDGNDDLNISGFVNIGDIFGFGGPDTSSPDAGDLTDMIGTGISGGEGDDRIAIGDNSVSMAALIEALTGIDVTTIDWATVDADDLMVQVNITMDEDTLDDLATACQMPDMDGIEDLLLCIGKMGVVIGDVDGDGGDDIILSNGIILGSIDGGADNDTIVSSNIVVGDLRGDDGDDSINNGFIVGGGIEGGDGDDTIMNSGALITGSIEGGEGDDTIINLGYTSIPVADELLTDLIGLDFENGHILAGDGDDVVINIGFVGGNIDGGDGDDTITNEGYVVDIIAGEGNDVIIVLTGSTVDGLIDGQDGYDTLNVETEACDANEAARIIEGMTGSGIHSWGDLTWTNIEQINAVLRDAGCGEVTVASVRLNKDHEFASQPFAIFCEMIEVGNSFAFYQIDGAGNGNLTVRYSSEYVMEQVTKAMTEGRDVLIGESNGIQFFARVDGTLVAMQGSYVFGMPGVMCAAEEAA
jgi:hypothetical protein